MEIPLSGKRGAGKVTLIDDDDAHLVLGRKWYMAGAYVGGYTPVTQKTELLHRVLMRPPKGMVVDHINDDPLDNRRANMRICRRGQNSTRGRRRSASGYRGVYRVPEGTNTRGPKRFRAAIEFQGKVHSLGMHMTDREAALAYDEAAKRLHGKFARLNF